RLDNEGRHSRLVLIGMSLEPAMFRLHKSKRERIECLPRTEPHKTTLTRIDIGLVGGSIARADAAIEAVGSDDKVGAVFFRNRLVIGDIGFEYEFHADFFATSLKDIEQFLAPYPNEPVAAAAQAAALVMNGDIVPM